MREHHFNAEVEQHNFSWIGEMICDGKAITERLKRLTHKRIPFLHWIKYYKRGYVLSDAVAGITVGLTVIPQSIGLAALAGLPPEYGLYSSYVACFMYVVFGSCRQAAIGPSTLLCLLVYETCGPDFPECSAWICLYTGIFQILMAMLQLGVLVSFISEPVILGYTGGAAVIAITAQIRKLLGMSVKNGPTTVATIQTLVENITRIRLADAVVGIGSICALFLFKNLQRISHRYTGTIPKLGKVLWSVSILRNAGVVIAASLIAWGLPHVPMKLTGFIQSGLPELKFPPLTLPLKVRGENGTLEQTSMSLLHTLENYGSAPMVAALIGVMQNVAIAKAFSGGQSVDAGQEMIALGMANAVASFFGAFPTCGAFSRSAINDASGVKSTLSGFFTGMLVLGALIFLTPAFYYIPQATLAAVVITAVSAVIDCNGMIRMWKISRTDSAVCFASFAIAIVFSLESAIGIGVCLSIVSFVVKSLKPETETNIAVDPASGIQYLLIKPLVDVQYPGIDHVRKQVNKSCAKYPKITNIVIDFEKWNSMNYTVSISVVKLHSSLKKAGINLIFLNCSNDWAEALQIASRDVSPFCDDNNDLSEYLIELNPTTNSLLMPMIGIH